MYRGVSTYRQITPIEGMYDEGLVANVYDSADAVAGVEGCTGARIILDCAVIVAMLDVLQQIQKKKLRYRYTPSER